MFKLSSWFSGCQISDFCRHSGVMIGCLVLIVVVCGCSGIFSDLEDDGYEQLPGMEDREEVQLTPDIRQLLDLGVRDLLTNKELSSSREFYGSRENQQVGLSYGWPSGYLPVVKGVKFERLLDGSDTTPDSPVLLGMGLDKVTITDDHADVEFTIYNLSGKNVIGGCLVRYLGEKTANGWRIRLMEAMDPKSVD